MASRL